MSVPVIESQFAIQGDLDVWSRPTDSGSVTDCYFCPECGTRLYHSGRNREGMITVKGGSLDDPEALTLLGHVWVRSKPSWLVLSDGLPQVETQPQTLDDWLAFLGIQ